MAFKNIIILFFFHTIFQSQLHNSIAAETWIKAGYYQANDISYSPNIQSINSTLYTHLIYGFANIDFNTSTDQMIVSISDDEQLKNFNNIVKKKNPSLKTLLSIGGKDQSSYDSGTGPGPKDYSFGAEAENEPFSSISSWLRFNDIKRGMIKYRANNASYNATYVMNYVSVETSWVGFDDVEAVKTKVAYAKEKHLRGYVAWQVSYDWNSALSQAAAGEVEDIQEGVIDQPGMHKKKKFNRVIFILIPVGAVLILLLLVFTLWCLRRRRLLKFQGRIPRNKIGSKNEDRRGGESSSLHVFTFEEMKAATNNFSADNELGRGGYGPVYKGKLRNGQEIAVKRLSETSTQGLEEFENEVILTAKLQHINLVKVVGFCIERKEKMLIYEYMPNKSLDYYIYNQVRRLLLNWEKRVQVIEGIIQGLLYLQEYSRLTIIHRDLKASNILLDIDMKPKISDFGMARIFKKDEVEANTLRVVGTMGYIPPEYVEQGIYSTKSDVFSFGVLFLRIISGKKNTCLHGPDENLNLLEYAFEMWRDGNGMAFMDPSLDDTTSSCKLLKCMQIALLCVQKNPLDRPTMLKVSYLLKDVNLAMNSPKRPAFSSREDEEVGNPNGSVQEIGEVDTATITQLFAR
ncbi:cysteine-rich receptor-like protein kinase 19 isoform X2 [Nicotiana tabacum]|uniref:Cysteine-rich receptor-like protein kinase 19 isoform X2 n=1 Tax=Nicotiana tabacum TaxID=4097 RepID=A0AC58T627_TOBAC